MSGTNWALLSFAEVAIPAKDADSQNTGRMCARRITMLEQPIPVKYLKRTTLNGQGLNRSSCAETVHGNVPASMKRHKSEFVITKESGADRYGQHRILLLSRVSAAANGGLKTRGVFR
jgi:hypothetical protein